MKTKHLAMLVLAYILYACTSGYTNNNEEIIDSVTLMSKEWKEESLTASFFEHQNGLSHYNFNKSDLQQILEKPNLFQFRFVLGLQNNELQITAVGIDKQGVILGEIKAYIDTNVDVYTGAIAKLEHSSFEYPITKTEQPVVGGHLLNYKDAYNYLYNWQLALQSQNIKELISYEGVRIRYFSLDKLVVAAMIAPQKATQISLFLGLNRKEKMTTVFIQKNSIGELILNSPFQKTNSVLDGEEGGGIYDFVDPCPDTCDGCWCPDGTWSEDCECK